MPIPLSKLPDPDVDRLPDLVAQALELPEADRAAFLERACADHPDLLVEVRSLLGHDQTDGFLEEPAFALSRAALGLHDGGELPSGTLLGEFETVRFLGQGGMGEVYLARDTKLERPVAIKLLKRSLDETTQLRRFRHERKVLAGLTHPNIARLYGGGTTPEGRSYLVMEYVDGERLDHFCETRRLGVRERLALFRKVCAAVAYAHQNLVVHRDLKPANIRVTTEGEPKLLDFGIAKLLDLEGTNPSADPTMTLQGAMTPEYASPEQVRGEAITTASDVYSLGVVLYELLTGQRPYAHLKGYRLDELARAICEEDPPRPSTVVQRQRTAGPRQQPEDARFATRAAPSVSILPPLTTSYPLPSTFGDLDNIVVKALRKEPMRRYAGAAALADDIRRYDEGLPVSARKDTFAYRAGKFVRRNRLGVVAAAAVLLALFGGLGATAWQAKRARQERDHARLAQRRAEHLNTFLENLLGSADPSSMGKDVKMVQVLDAAGQNLDVKLADEPEILAQAHATLYRTYRNLGLYDPAERHARAALAAVRRVHGSEDLATADAEFDLGDVLANRRQVAESEALLRHVLSVYRSQTPPDPARLTDTLASLGYVLYSQPQRITEAETLVEEAFRNAKAAWGDTDPRFLRVLNELATVKIGRRDYAGAADIFRRVIALQDRITPGGISSLPAQANLCICLINQEKLDDLQVAADHLEEEAHRLTGENSLLYTVAMVAHGLLDFLRGDYRSATPLLQKAVQQLSITYSPDNVSVVQCQAVLGLCLTRDGQAPAGEPSLRAAYEHCKKVDPADFAHTIGDVDTALGECLLAQKRYAEAEPLLLAGDADLKKRLGENNRLTVHAEVLLRNLYTAWNKPEQAARFVSHASVP